MPILIRVSSLSNYHETVFLKLNRFITQLCQCCELSHVNKFQVFQLSQNYRAVLCHLRLDIFFYFPQIKFKTKIIQFILINVHKTSTNYSGKKEGFVGDWVFMSLCTTSILWRKKDYPTVYHS